LGLGKRKTNKLDARKLASRLYSYVQGDGEMMREVRIPSPELEQLRIESRQYDQLVQTRKAVSMQARSLGHHERKLVAAAGDSRPSAH
jgi:hypothetical protein